MVSNYSPTRNSGREGKARDPQEHLLSLRSFASASPNPVTPSQFVDLRTLALPLIENFLDGDQSAKSEKELTAVLPALRGALNAMTRTVSEDREKFGSIRENAETIRDLVLCGGCISAALQGLAPESEQADSSSTVNYADPQLIERNLMQAALLLVNGKIDFALREGLSDQNISAA